MASTQPYRINTISQYHQVMGLPKPEHPLVSVINLESIKYIPIDEPISLVFDFYSISLKRFANFKFKYGQQEMDFDEGVMFFISPGQVLGIEVEKGVPWKRTGWMLLVHPDFLWNTPLAKTKKRQLSVLCRAFSRNIIQTLTSSARTLWSPSLRYC